MDKWSLILKQHLENKPHILLGQFYHQQLLLKIYKSLKPLKYKSNSKKQFQASIKYLYDKYKKLLNKEIKLGPFESLKIRLRDNWWMSKG